jgi:hypothetical protein
MTDFFSMKHNFCRRVRHDRCDYSIFPGVTLYGGVRRRAASRHGPLSIRATLESAHLVVDPIEADALSKLDAQYCALYGTEDFLEGRRAEAEGRPPRYHGK